MSNKADNIILKTENLSIGYQQKKQNIVVASAINLYLEKGKLITVLGKNGIGKSTFLRTIANVQKPLSGAVFIKKQLIQNYENIEFAKLVSMVLTERLPESQLTVFELIATGRQPYTNWIDSLTKEDIEKINWAIEQTGIQHLKHKRFYELSDGQLQHVLIARALAQDTPIIILDEPTAHLDLHNTIKIIQLLKELVHKTGKTIIMSSHQVNLSIQLADEIILFKDKNIVKGIPSKLIEEGAFDDLFSSKIIYFNKEVQQFIVNTK
uniref:ABC transporter ATP-binding protein n=1 Tax=uncultured Polaribacter sp. TaxID=174711 RepID=UPI002608A77E|nr:ABC transporter ATP-binding protein [uncultured Polaribacter sp.]